MGLSSCAPGYHAPDEVTSRRAIGYDGPAVSISPKLETLSRSGFVGIRLAVGPQRGHDRWAVAEDPSGRVGIVADGVGGIGGAAEAAEVVANGLLARLSSPIIEPGAFCEEILACDRDVARTADGGQASAAIVRLTQTHILAASVGDAEVWIWCDARLRRLSGRRKHGTGFEMGTTVAMPELVYVERGPIDWVGLLSDGAVRHLSEDQIVDLLGATDPLRRWLGHLEDGPPVPDDDLTLLVTRP